MRQGHNIRDFFLVTKKLLLTILFTYDIKKENFRKVLTIKISKSWQWNI